MRLLVGIAGAFGFGVAAANAVTVRRYSRAHVAGEVALGGRGVFFSRTPDGVWWRLRLRSRRCTTTFPVDGDDSPPDGGAREPRRPPGLGPLDAAAKNELPWD